MERPKQEEVKRLKREAVEAEKNKKKRAQSVKLQSGKLLD